MEGAGTEEPLLAVKNALDDARMMLEGRTVTPNCEDRMIEEKSAVTFTHSSPKRAAHPFEVIVRHSQIAEEHNTDEDGDGEDDDEFLEASEEFDQHLHLHHNTATNRRWSLDTDGGEHVSMDVCEEDDEQGGRHHRRIRYRLRRNNDDAAAVTERRNGDDDDDFDDDDELEVEMDEEAIVCFPGLETARKGTRHIVKRFWEARWKAQHFDFLPDWLQDNEFLRTGHRPPMPSFGACFQSIFSLHSESGNIWTHLFGCVAFIGVAGWFLSQQTVQWQEKVVFSIFFASAIACLGLSFAFHTVYCHSITVGKLFSKLDYVGISLLIMGSFIPWIFYGFYCRREPQITYIAMICVFGVAAVIVSLWDKFSEPRFRPLRAGVFAAMGLSGVVPAVHFMITDGMRSVFDEISLHWLLLMAFFYLFGALLYATRTPERFFPGKCDIWFQSHQLFHMCVVVAAFVHYHGISEMAVNRLQGGSCPEQNAADYLKG